jgi:hypothetical protein
MSLHVTRGAEEATLEPFKAETLPSNGRPIAVRVRFHGNVFTESLPSSGYIRHRISFHFCWFVNHFIGTSDSAASDYKGYGRKRPWPDVSYYIRIFLRGIRRTTRCAQSGLLVFQPRLELGTFRIIVRNFTSPAILLVKFWLSGGTDRNDFAFLLRILQLTARFSRSYLNT